LEGTRLRQLLKNYINKKIIWGITIFFLTTIVGFLVYGFGQINWSSGTGQSRIPFDISQIEWANSSIIPIPIFPDGEYGC
jgi:hypothetical protein